ncbi:response regulator transcription factor [Pedobacter sp. JY14-1]|uniref:response regulator transcription factor n=1 Tax=Pedobacter sp. JY14-1 TaxID=3034151 RepID=UPI0023E0F8C6|nr:response regulator transcription factor [Pedobacter sp. JY14-1]
MYKIGLAEDDNRIASLIKSGLEENGYEVTAVGNGQEAFSEFLKTGYDLLILDVMMPGMNGLKICRQLRKENADVPVLLLTALGAVDDKVGGFNAGADDYLVKPFHFRELLVRLEALLRRSRNGQGQSLLTFADMTMDTAGKTVTRNGVPISLTAREYILLELFMKNPNRVLSRQYIAENAWDINFDTGTNVIDVYVNFLRKKIEKDQGRRLIHTRIGMGYVLREEN